VSTPDDLVHVEVADGVRTVTLDSQHNRNALSRQLVTELVAALDGAADDPDTKVVRLRAAGKAFCAGADLSEAAGADDAQREAATRGMVAMMRSVVACPAPVVAEVHAPVRAGGIGLVAACDIAVAGTSANFSLTEVRLALTPAVISLTVLPRLTNRAASRTFLTGELFDGARAAEIGLVTESVDDDALAGHVDALCAELAAHPAQGLTETKRLLAGPLLARLDAGEDEMVALSARLFGSEAAQQAMLAFLSRGR
jgi:enoyl-CoA hydratase/carnithine racemase